MKGFFGNAASVLQSVTLLSVLGFVMMFQACDKDDPTPVHEQEVITTVEVTLVPQGGGIPVTLKFYDADGEQGSIAPLITTNGSLRASTTYSGVIELRNETVNPVADITGEVAEEGEDHLFCFEVSENLNVQYEDEDANGLPLGLLTTWTTAGPGESSVTISLRHQAGVKTGECPGGGETDVEITFDLLIE